MSFQNLWGGVIGFAPKLIIAIIVFVIGLLVASIIGKFVDKIIGSLRVDSAFKSVGVDEMLHKGGFTLNSGAFIGDLVKWFLVIVFLVASLDILGLTEVNDFLKNVVLGYLPNVIVAALILVVAAFIANAMQKIVVGSAKAAGAPSTHFLGGLTKVVHLGVRHFGRFVSVGNLRSFCSNFVYRIRGYGRYRWRIGFRFGWTRRSLQIHRAS